MAGNPRLKGQEVFVTLLVNNVISAGFDAVVDLTVTDNVETLEEKFLGEVSDRLDDIYNSTSFSTTIQIEGVAPDEVRRQIIDRAKRRAGSFARFDLSFAQALPTGETLQIQLQNIFWGAVEKSISGRGDFVTLGLEGMCTDVEEQLL